MEKTEQEWNEFVYTNVPVVASLMDLYKMKLRDGYTIPDKTLKTILELKSNLSREDDVDEVITKVGYIISVSKSMHPADTPQRKINLMVGHAEDALVRLEQLKEEKDGEEKV